MHGMAYLELDDKLGILITLMFSLLYLFIVPETVTHGPKRIIPVVQQFDMTMYIIILNR
jgi:hypothetical protein